MIPGTNYTTYIHIQTHTYTYLYVLTYIRIGYQIHKFTLHAYAYTHIHTHTHTYLCALTYIHIRLQYQAQITLKAARESEIEDEGRLHALERRWRVTQAYILKCQSRALIRGIYGPYTGHIRLERRWRVTQAYILKCLYLGPLYGA